MKIHCSKMNNGIGLIKLTGNLDINGTGEVKAKFADYCTGDRARIIVDLADVNVLSSAGIRLLISNAKSLASRGGKMALLNPSQEVLHVLEGTEITVIMPVYSRLESVEAVLLAP